MREEVDLTYCSTISVNAFVALGSSVSLTT